MRRVFAVGVVLSAVFWMLGANLSSRLLDTTVRVHSTEQSLYYWDPGLSKWVGPTQEWKFGHTTDNYLGPLKTTANINSDSTAALEFGYKWPEDMLVTRVYSYGSAKSGDSDNRTLLMATGQDTILRSNRWSDATPTAEHDTTISYTLSSGSFMSAYTVSGGISAADDPFVIVTVRPLLDTVP